MDKTITTTGTSSSIASQRNQAGSAAHSDSQAGKPLSMRMTGLVFALAALAWFDLGHLPDPAPDALVTAEHEAQSPANELAVKINSEKPAAQHGKTPM